MSSLLSLAQSVSDSLVEPLGWMLIHSLWQFTLVALVAAIALRAMRRRSALLRYAVLVTALGLSAAAPVATWILQLGNAPARKSYQISPSRELVTAESFIPGTETPLRGDERIIARNAPETRRSGDLDVPSNAMVPPPALPPASPASAQPPESIWNRASNLVRQWLGWIVAGWLVGVILCCARPILGWYSLVRLRRVGVSAASDELLAALERVSTKLGFRRAVPILQSSLARVPMVVGYLRPVILVPLSFATIIPVAQLEAILAHELAHVRRHDFLVNLLQTLAETLFFYHPAIWWLSSRIRIEREHCCDDLVVELFDNRLAYGRALVALEEMGARDGLFALGAADGSLLSRVRRILGANSGSNRSVRPSNGPLCLSAICTLLAMIAIGIGMNTHAEQPPKDNIKQAEIKAEQPPSSQTSATTDLFGDPLPKGAVARLGTTRFRHGGWYLTSVNFLPDSATMMTTTSGDSEIVFWEAATGKRLREIRTDPMTIQGFALSQDGKKMAVGGFWYPEDRSKGARGELRVLDTATGATIRAFPRESRDSSHFGLAFSKDGRLIFSMADHGILRVEEISSGAEILQQKFQGDNSAALDLSPDGKTLAIVSGPNVRKFFLWDWQAGAEPREIKTFTGQDGGGILVFSPDGCHVAWCDSGSEPLHVWEVKSGKLVARLPLPNLDDSWAGSLIFSPDGKKLVAPAGPNRSGRVDIWNTITWKLERHLDVAARQIAISPDSRLLTTGGRMFNFDSGEEIGGIDGAHRGQIGQILNVPGGQVITSSDDGSIRIWDPLNGRHVRKLLHEYWVRGIAISPDGQRLVSSSLDDTVRLFDLRTEKEIYRLPGHGRQGGLRAVTFIADGQSFASFGDDYYLRIWDVRTGKALAEHLIQPTGVKVPGENDERDFLQFINMEGARFSPRGKYLLLGAHGKVHVFDVVSGKEVRVFEREGGRLRSMEIAPDERQLVTCSLGKQLQFKLPDGSTQYTTEQEDVVTLWDLESGKILLTFRAAGGGGAVAFAPDGQHIAVATSRPKNQVAMHDLKGTRQQVVEDIPSRIHSVQISGEGKLIVGLDDTSALVYDLRIPVKK